MSLRHWIMGCALGLAGIGSAAATSMSGETQDSSSAVHAVGDAPGGAGGAAPEGAAARGDHGPEAGHASRDDSVSPGEGPGGSSTRPARRTHRLGWQSLLPGSIQ